MRTIFFTFLITIFASSLAFSQYTIDTGGGVATCSGTFFDSGGDGGNYGNNENEIMTFCSDNSTCLQVSFTEFDLDSSDILYIYNGASTSSALLATLTGNTLPTNYLSFFGCLTFQFVSNDTITSSGWAANLSCGPCLLPGGGNGVLNPSYDNQACGLNYTQVSTKITTRYATPAGTGLPATLNLTGLPPNNTCWVVEKALLYWTESSQNNNPVTLSVINSDPETFNFNVTPLGVGPSKCWQELNSKNFRVDVSAAIIGNGNYTIDISSGTWPVDGVTLLVIYRDLTATYTGRLMINDGTMASNGNASFAQIDNINACATSTSGTTFLMVGDIQDSQGPSYNGTLNGNTYAFPRNFWNFDEKPTTVTAGQTSATFGVDPVSGDCYSWAAVGLYYQTNCLTCPTNAFSVPVSQTATTCYGSNIKTNPGGGKAPYTYLWNSGETTQTLFGVPDGTYSVTVTDNIGCVARDTIDVLNVNVPAMSVFNYNICHTDSILLAGSYHNTSGTYNDTIFGGSSTGCDSIISHILVVNPSLTVVLLDTIVCDGAPLPTTNFISNPVGATYSWTNSNTAIGLGASGVGNINSFTATNNTPTAINSIITVTPSQNGCVGTPNSYNITVNPSPIVDLLPDLTFCNGDNVSVSNYSSSTTGATFDWTNNNTTIGLGASGNGNTPIFTAINNSTNPVTSIISVTATSNGCTGPSTDYPITVDADPTVSFTLTNACENSSVQFSDASIGNGGNINQWNWDFGDGSSTSTLQNPSQYYATAGTYSVNLIVTTTNGCTNTIAQQVTVYALPHASFDFDKVCEDATTTFSNTSTITPIDNDVIDQYDWSFGNGSTSANENPTLDYGTENVYNAKLVITTNYGCKDSIEHAVDVYPLPIVDFSPTEVCLEFDTHFLDESTVSNDHTSNHNVAWDWDFADGYLASVQNPVHTYQTDGIFNAVLTVTTDHNCTATETIPVTVYPKPVASFTGINLEGCAPVCPTLTSTSTINNPSIITNYKWELSDGTIYEGSESTSSECYYNETGEDINYGLLLTVTSDKGCIDSYSEANYISVYHNPIANFFTTPTDPDVLKPTVEFHNTSLYANYYNWTIGYYGQTGEVNPIVDFPPDSATYEAELIAYTDKGCTDTARTVVRILDRLIFYVPNTFTPDNDEYNETFKPIFTSGFDPQTYTLYIFNRWGELIFESHNTNVGWDGKYGTSSSKKVQDGTYIWKIDFKTSMNDEHKTYTGHVNILK